MTGFGRSELENNEIDITVEIKSVNSRYKDIQIRLPVNLNSLDPKIRNTINPKVNRGKIEVIVSYLNTDSNNSNIEINESLARSLSKNLDKLMKYNTLIEPSIDLSIFTMFPDLLTIKEDKLDSNRIWEQVEPCLNEAINDFIQSREIEGNNLKEDINEHYNQAKVILEKIKKLAPESIKESQNKLKERLELSLADVDLDEVRFLNEVAILADKLAIDEEITRLESHFQTLETLIEEEGPIGRKMDFLIQELNRETNTIGSKTDSIEITNHVVDLKSEIEKIREQVQNVE